MNHTRLPDHIIPSRYELTIRPDFRTESFSGSETIHVTLKKPVREIVLHAKELSVLGASFKSGTKTLASSTVVFDKKSETATFRFQSALPKGKGEFYIEFSGLLSESMSGFYKSRYTHEGKEKILATTQFEATDARKVFPCFDEPAHKAVFDVTLMIPGHLTAVSNTVEETVIEHDSGYKTVKFAPTPKMSTYLLAFIVGEFEHIESATARGVRVRVFTTHGKKHQAQFSLDTAVRCLEFYEKYFGIKYSLPILDLIAIPDFEHSAMENWGAITYRETALLVDPKYTSSSNKQWTAIVIAHELAHQWFGNLVTMHWWTDLWLNEGFAEYMEYVAVDHLFPEWNIWSHFLSSRFERALHLDSLKDTHPVQVEIRDASEIAENFDMISYAKGAAVIRMLAEYLGEKDFQKGVRHYLKKHLYGNTLTEDLWKALEEASGKPVRKMMHAWITQPGYPVVSVSVNNGLLQLRQKRYFASKPVEEKSRDRKTWPIPVKIQSINSKFQMLETLLTKKVQKIRLSEKFSASFKVNPGEVSVMRTAYSPELLESLKPAVEQKMLSAQDRLGLVRDAFALARSGESETPAVLSLMRAYAEEDDYVVWLQVADSMRKLLMAFRSNDKVFGGLSRYGRELFIGVAEKLGWEHKKQDSHSKVLLRSLAQLEAGSFGCQPAIDRARELFNKATGNPVPVELRGAVYGLVAAFGGPETFDRFMEMYKEAGMEEERGRIRDALARTRHKPTLKKVLDFAFSNSVRDQDLVFMLVGLLENPFAFDLAWEELKRRWPELLRRYGEGSSMLTRPVTALGFVADRDLRNDMQAFFTSNPLPVGKRALAQALESIEANIDWVKRDTHAIEKWLES